MVVPPLGKLLGADGYATLRLVVSPCRRVPLAVAVVEPIVVSDFVEAVVVGRGGQLRTACFGELRGHRRGGGAPCPQPSDGA